MTEKERTSPISFRPDTEDEKNIQFIKDHYYNLHKIPLKMSQILKMALEELRCNLNQK